MKPRLLLDNALSPALASDLRSRGIDAIHVRDMGLRDASDPVVLAAARDLGRVLVSRDGDFSTLLVVAEAVGPSFIHLRSPGVNRVNEQVDLLLEVLERVSDEFATGAIVTVRSGSIRVRSLPIRRSDP